jgi:uncharacterized damage-inducible protein DinB
MNKQSLEQQWQFQRMTMNATRRMVEQFPEDKMDFRPAAGSRSVAEILSHMYTFPTDSVLTVKTGKHVSSDEPVFSKKADLLAWIDQQVATAYAEFEQLTDSQVSAEIECWGHKFFGFQLLGFVFQEHIHHRGQLTVYLRLLGITPLNVYAM